MKIHYEWEPKDIVPGLKVNFEGVTDSFSILVVRGGDDIWNFVREGSITGTFESAASVCAHLNLFGFTPA